MLKEDQKQCLIKLLNCFKPSDIGDRLFIPTTTKKKHRWEEEEEFVVLSDGQLSHLDNWQGLFQQLYGMDLLDPDTGVKDHRWDSTGSDDPAYDIDFFNPDAGITIWFRDELWDEVLKISHEQKTKKENGQ